MNLVEMYKYLSDEEKNAFIKTLLQDIKDKKIEVEDEKGITYIVDFLPTNIKWEERKDGDVYLLERTIMKKNAS